MALGDLPGDVLALHQGPIRGGEPGWHHCRHVVLREDLPSVVTVVAQKPMAAVLAWQDGYDKALSMLHEWSLSLSDLLTEELRILLRMMKSAVKDFCLLLRAAILKKQSIEDWVVMGDEMEV